MLRVDAYASLEHYAEHLLPIWEALPDEARGIFYTAGRDTDWWGVELPRKWLNRGPMLVASYSDAVRVRPRPMVLVEHGAGQTYVDVADHPSYSGGSDLHDVVLFVAPNETVADRWRARYPNTPVAVVGCPKLDAWHACAASKVDGDGGRAATAAGGELSLSTKDRAPVVAFGWHWDCSLVPETRTAWPHYDEALPVLLDEAKRRGWQVLGHAHPRLWGRIVRRYRELGMHYSPKFADVLDWADVFVCDNSSAMWEFASLDRPLVVLDAPWYRRDVEHGLRFWRHADAGVRIGDPGDLVDAIALALDDPLSARTLRRRASREVYAATDGHAASRAASAIVELLGEPMPNPFAPRIKRTSVERQSDVEALAVKLAAVGASPEDIAEFRSVWASGDIDDDDRARLHELVGLDDLTLRRMLAAQSGLEANEDEPVEVDTPGTVLGVIDSDPATGTLADPARSVLSDPGGPDDPIQAEAERLVADGSSVQVLLDWIGGDPARALAVEGAERRNSPSPRSTLLEGVRKVTGA